MQSGAYNSMNGLDLTIVQTSANDQTLNRKTCELILLVEDRNEAFGV